jgi:phosphoribosyl-ATP pyrophosphohydrolase
VDVVAEVVRLADEFDFPMTLSERIDKCREEDEELYRAYSHGDFDNMVDEAADRVITGFLLLRSLGVNPGAAVVCKIDKSRRERNQVNTDEAA